MKLFSRSQCYEMSLTYWIKRAMLNLSKFSYLLLFLSCVGFDYNASKSKIKLFNLDILSNVPCVCYVFMSS